MEKRNKVILVLIILFTVLVLGGCVYSVINKEPVKESDAVKFRNEYMKLTEISKADIAKWEVPVAAARLRESISDKERKVLSDIVNARLSRL